MKQTIITQSAEETQALGENLGKLLIPGDIILLFGDLGAGKTTFTQGISRGLGMYDYVRSPSFTLINEYAGTVPIYHIDLYRLETFEEIESLGIEEVFNGKGVCIVEWAEKIMSPTSVPEFGIVERIEIRIRIEDENRRRFEVHPQNLPQREFPLFPLQ